MSTQPIHVDASDRAASPIAGLSTLKGLVLYGATLTFAGVYIYFIIEITTAKRGDVPSFDAALVSAAAALAGVLGSAFALEVGTTTDAGATNVALGDALIRASGVKQKALARLWQALSLQPRTAGTASWPKTAGIWIYATVASAVSITYVLNPNETPATIRALAVAFGGYVITLVTASYRSAGE